MAPPPQLVACHRGLTREQRHEIHRLCAAAGVHIASGIVKGVSHLCTPAGLAAKDYAFSTATSRGIHVLPFDAMAGVLRAAAPPADAPLPPPPPDGEAKAPRAPPPLRRAGAGGAARALRPRLRAGPPLPRPPRRRGRRRRRPPAAGV
ncbi:hypothetical protein AB1Y20_008840 [Prymnesium parvum]|uniref:BRCT domain-containing protein n=1 Tax=Prymnesium parvum TaxID=97485 RepID=A0AB34IRP0_PRYPA